MNAPSLRERYSSRLKALDALARQLGAQEYAGDGAAVVKLLLEAAGDVLRRAQALGASEEAVRAHLRAVPESALAAWAAGVDLQQLKVALQRGAQRAVESAIPDDPDDEETLATWAMNDLDVRDGFESALVALEQLGGLGRADAQRLASRFRSEVRVIDAACSGFALSFTALNSKRRAEAALLDAPLQARAWWYSESAGMEADRLVKVLGGDSLGTLPPHVQSVHQEVTQKRTRAPSFDELFRFDGGLASPAEREMIRRRAERDPELKLALAAMDAGDAAILEALAPVSAEVPSSSRESSEPQVLAARGDFKVLLLNTKRQVQLVVQPKRAELLVAQVFRDEKQLAPLPGPYGTHFEFAPEDAGSGVPVRVLVKLADGSAETVELWL